MSELQTLVLMEFLFNFHDICLIGNTAAYKQSIFPEGGGHRFVNTHYGSSRGNEQLLFLHIEEQAGEMTIIGIIFSIFL